MDEQRPSERRQAERDQIEPAQIDGDRGQQEDDDGHESRMLPVMNCMARSS